MVRTKQTATSRFGGRVNTPSVTSSSYFHDGSNAYSSGISSQSQSLINNLRSGRDHGLVEYSSQFYIPSQNTAGTFEKSSNPNLFTSQGSTTSGVLTQSQSNRLEVVRRPKPSAIKTMKRARIESSIKKRRYRPGTRALMEIRKLQRTCHLLMKRAPFFRVVKDIVRSCSKGIDYKIQSEAINCLQEASEAFLITIFEASNMCAIHGKRVTLMPADLLLVQNVLSLFNVQLGGNR
ncbi:unnamed protein product [Bursaphelenchus okinawaensis]|uniref:Core Histone H2A/H2B/H3 domain-containing protein n=1 Tax=Bursaphelenchus okinawaensis TaxID=465554 RepID=A0A811LL10_9BILA|nr:unnamed protein product [Bursaphelenchus okinawaensis]CAG9125940.1 unnamed protein product [Bursaphelenchus okinawaensis]